MIGICKLFASLMVVCGVATAARATTKSEHFDGDPGWEGFQNRLDPKVNKTVAQAFGYSAATHFAGQSAGEIGGTIWRSSTRASYADPITPAKTLADRLSASGTFAITATDGSSGMFFGWFKSDAPEGSRQNSLGIHFAGQGSGARLTLQLVTADNQACGTKITPWVVDKTKPRGEGRKFRPTSIRNDGTRYTWQLDYDPAANNGDGQMQFSIRSDRAEHEEWEGKTFTVSLPKGYKDKRTTFDRFGLVNSARPGNAMTIYFDDLQYDGKSEDFAHEAAWVGDGNHTRYPRRDEGGAHDFGFSADSNHAGGSKPGELGGTVWRSGLYGYYADRVGPLSLDDKLEASGKVVLTAGPPDSGVYFGWFNSEEKDDSPVQAGQFVGVRVGGPTRVGHYFVPAYATAVTAAAAAAEPARPNRAGDVNLEHAPSVSVERKEGPVLVPQTVFDWKLVYDPAANGGGGAIAVTLGDRSVTLPLKRGDKAKGATFDRFGLFTTHRGGSYLRIYFDDITYTTGK